MFWGLSEAVDFCEQYLKITKSNDSNQSDQNNQQGFTGIEEINILIFGSNDPRHLLKTMAKLYTHKGQLPLINFYVVDGCMEIVARNMLLLSIALENSESMSLGYKVKLFMDVYGNALMTASSYQYLVAKTKMLLKVVTDDDYMTMMTPIFNIDGLKYRERDGLENAFNFWLPKEENVFQIHKYWTDRLRKLMGTRYDYREGQFDWDLNMVLKDRGGQQICSQEYRYWRECGIAFTFPEFEYCKPNKTLSAGLVCNGTKYAHRGYIGDIQTGPFVAFGLTTTDMRMLKSVHGENDYRSTDITERNLLELFYELATQAPFEHDLTHTRKYGSTRLQMGKCLIHSENDKPTSQNSNEPWITVDKVKIYILSSDDIFALQDPNERWTEFFDLAFVSHNYFELLKDTFTNILRPGSALILETKLMTTERKEYVTSFEEKLKKFAKRTNLEHALNYNALNIKNTLLKFKKPLK